MAIKVEVSKHLDIFEVRRRVETFNFTESIIDSLVDIKKGYSINGLNPSLIRFRLATLNWQRLTVGYDTKTGRLITDPDEHSTVVSVDIIYADVDKELFDDLLYRLGDRSLLATYDKNKSWWQRFIHRPAPLEAQIAFEQQINELERKAKEYLQVHLVEAVIDYQKEIVQNPTPLHFKQEYPATV